MGPILNSVKRIVIKILSFYLAALSHNFLYFNFYLLVNRFLYFFCLTQTRENAFQLTEQLIHILLSEKNTLH